MRGGFEPLPRRLGPGNGPEESFTAGQHARVCADLLAVQRCAPIAVINFSVVGTAVTINHLLTQQPATVPEPVAQYVALGGWTATFSMPTTSAEVGTDARALAIPTSAVATAESTAAVSGLYAYVVGSTVVVGSVDAPPATITLVIYGTMRRQKTTIGHYGGSLNKRDDYTENPVPFAAQIYRDLQQQKGSLYTKRAGTFVHVGHLVRARMWASVAYRLPQKFTNNVSGPRKADEGLEYWASVMALPDNAEESKQDFRQRASVFFLPAKGATYDNMVSEFSALLGDAFVGITRNHDDLFESPPATTYWPVFNPGPSGYNLGGGTWLSERAQITIDVQRPGGMSEAEFYRLVNVDLFTLVDRMIPAWCTAKWSDASSVRVVWDGDDVTWDGGHEWNSLFDWND